MSHEHVRAIVAAAQEMQPEPPRPLMRESVPPDPFPVDALGDVLELAARAIHDRVQAPLAICGQSVLANTTLAVQAHADVVLPIGGSRAKPIELFCDHSDDRRAQDRMRPTGGMADPQAREGAARQV
jgi:hypothetical protein